MAPTLDALAQSESKLRFMERLGLSSTISGHKNIYALMKTEAIKAREVMLVDRSVLLPHLRDDTSIQPPYSSSQVTDIAMRNAVSGIYEHASPDTKPYYDQGHDIDSAEEASGQPFEDNWIIRWMLWHVFRYRDSRNKHRSYSIASTTTSSATDFSAEAIASSRHGSYSTASGVKTTTTTTTTTTAAAAAQTPRTSLEGSQTIATSTRPQGTLPWDPTRDS